MRIIAVLMMAGLKMFVRQREAILWTILLPLFMVFLFSFVKFDGLGTLALGIVNYSRDTTLVSLLRPMKALKIHEGEENDELGQLQKGDRDLVIVITSSFQPGGHDSLTVYLNAERPRETQAGRMIIQRVIDELVFQRANILRPTLHAE